MKRRVLILADGLGNGGAERQLALLGRYLPPDWEVRIWSMSDGPFRTVLENAHVRVDVWKRSWRFDVAPAFSLWRLITDWSPEVVHAWGWMSCIAAIPLCRVLRIPVINGTIRNGNNPIRQKWLKSLGLTLANGVIANSRAGLVAYHISNLQSRVIYNGFDPERLGLINNENKDEKFTIAMAARMTKEKDFRSLIDAVRCLVHKCSNLRVLAIGAGPERSKLVEYAKDLIEKTIIEFPEAGLEVLPLVSSADVGILMTTPSIHEGCSNTLIEYMACKLPIICTHSGGNQEIIIDGQTGFLIQPGDSKALVEKLSFLYCNRDRAQMMGEAGYKRFLEMFSVERMINETMEFYCGLLKK